MLPLIKKVIPLPQLGGLAFSALNLQVTPVRVLVLLGHRPQVVIERLRPTEARLLRHLRVLFLALLVPGVALRIRLSIHGQLNVQEASEGGCEFSEHMLLCFSLSFKNYFWLMIFD